jgi:hypothetical protein
VTFSVRWMRGLDGSILDLADHDRFYQGKLSVAGRIADGMYDGFRPAGHGRQQRSS